MIQLNLFNPTIFKFGLLGRTDEMNPILRKARKQMPKATFKAICFIKKYGYLWKYTFIIPPCPKGAWAGSGYQVEMNPIKHLTGGKNGSRPIDSPGDCPNRTQSYI